MRATLPRPVCTLADVGIAAAEGCPAETAQALADYFAQFLRPEPAEVGNGTMCVCGVPLTGFMAGSFTWGLSHGEGYCRACGRPARAYHRPRDREGEMLSMTAVLLYLPHPDDPSCSPVDPEEWQEDEERRGRMHRAAARGTPY